MKITAVEICEKAGTMLGIYGEARILWFHGKMTVSRIFNHWNVTQVFGIFHRIFPVLIVSTFGNNVKILTRKIGEKGKLKVSTFEK